MKQALIVVGFAILAGSAQAQSASEKSDLAERCGRRVAEYFAKKWGDGVLDMSTGRNVRVNYENHYNSRLNKCLYLETITTYDPGRASSTRTGLTLYDINDNAVLAMFGKTESGEVSCSVQEKFCQTEQEWRELIRPFMED